MRNWPWNQRGWFGPMALAAACAVTGPGRPAFGWQDPAPDDGSGVQVLTQGPIHEAFAEPVVYDPRPGPVIPKQPPAPVEELPPDQKPEGDNVQWVPGYWAWDDGRNDFLWVSGIWRAVPPGRQWVPGYWNQAEQGFQWVPGVWAPLTQPDQGDQAVVQPLQYLPTPPPSIEAGPNTPPPSDNVTWSPGCWVWSEGRYVWRPGFWVPVQPDWLWVPAHYSWSPGGSMFIDGYWDRPLTSRGQMFAPVYFQQPVYARPNYVYTPTVGILATALMSSLFVRPSYSSYYFGDYYGGNSAQTGIYPWYSYHQSRYGYDPIYAYASQVNSRRDPQWVDQVHETYRYRREHPEARPPRTYVEQTRIVNGVTNVNNVTNINNVTNNLTTVNNVNNARNLVLARPIAQIAANTQSPVRYEKLDAGARREITRQSGEVRQFHEQRVREEVQAAKLRPANANPAEAQPRVVRLPKSPIAAPLAARSEGAPPERRAGLTPPPPSAPKPNPSVRPGAPGQPVVRHDPGLDQKPPEHLQPVRPGYRPPPGPGRPEPAARPEPIRTEAPKPEAPKPFTPKPEAPKPVAPRPEPPKPEAPKPEPPRPVAPKPEAPKPAQPRPGATASEAFGLPGQPGRPTGNP
ncbi:MAG: hypothetical protein LC745_08410, partial [Planctomycetia bacterium]|nr:hypothetical protein [Planctomycetia bacterium]